MIGAVLHLMGLESGMTGRLFSVFMLFDKYTIGFAGVGLIYLLSVWLNKTKARDRVKCVGGLFI